MQPSQAMSIQTVTLHNRSYELRLTRCGKRNCRVCYDRPPNSWRPPGHGPYWYLAFSSGINQQWRRIYIGKTLDTARFITPEGQIDFAAIDAARRVRRNKRNAQPTAPNQPCSAVKKEQDMEE